MNDNFGAIADAIQEGRGASLNLKKAIAYSISANILKMTPVLLLVAFDFPLHIGMSLVAMFLIDLILAVCRTYEVPSPALMKNAPEKQGNRNILHYSNSAYMMMIIAVLLGLGQALIGPLIYLAIMSSSGFET